MSGKLALVSLDSNSYQHSSDMLATGYRRLWLHRWSRRSRLYRRWVSRSRVCIHFIFEAIIHTDECDRTARAEKLKKLNQAVNVPGLEFTQIDDVATDDFTIALKDVDILVHVASPLAGRGNVDETLTVSIYPRSLDILLIRLSTVRRQWYPQCSETSCRSWNREDRCHQQHRRSLYS